MIAAQQARPHSKAKQTGRECYGLEIEPKYVAVTLERMAGMRLEPRLSSHNSQT